MSNHWLTRNRLGLLTSLGIVLWASSASAECHGVIGLSCDLTLFKESGFVVRGRQLPGASARLGLADSRVSLSINEVQGADLFAKDRVGVTNSFLNGENWRREMSLDLGVVRSELIEVDLNAGFSDLRLPSTIGQSMKIGAFSDWERNRVSDTSVDVSLLNGRIAYQSSYFRSEYASESTSEYASEYFMNFDDRTAGADWDEVGAAHWHKVEAQLLRGEDASASFYGLYWDVDPEFRSLREKTVSVYTADGTKRRFGGDGTLTANRKTARENAKSFRTGTYWAPGENEIAGRFGELGGVVKLGKFEFTGRLNSRTEQNLDQTNSDPQTAKTKVRFRHSPFTLTAWSKNERSTEESEETWGGRADLSIDKVFGLAGVKLGSGLAFLLPDNFSAQWSRQTAVGPVSGHPDQTGNLLGFGVDWEWDNAVTSTSFSRHVSQSGGSFSAADDSTDYSMDASHTMFREGWDVTVYLSANQLTSGKLSAASRDLYLGGGASLWLGLKSLPDFVAGVDFNKFSSHDALSSSLYRDWDVKLSLDFSKYIWSGQKDPRKFIRLSHHIQGITNAGGSDALQGEEINHAFVFLWVTPL